MDADTDPDFKKKLYKNIYNCFGRMIDECVPIRKPLKIPAQFEAFVSYEITEANYRTKIPELLKTYGV